MSKTYCVYILASRSRNLYTGVTNNLHRRLAEHRLGVVPGFTSRYKIFRLVHYEVLSDIRAAIAREKQIKAWRRERKVWLIEGENSTWSDLSEGWFRDKQSANPENVVRKRQRKFNSRSLTPAEIRPGSG